MGWIQAGEPSIDVATPEHKKTESVALETATHLIKGTVTLPLEGYRARFSDYLNRADLDYLSLVDAVREPLGGGPRTYHRYLAIARKSILFAYSVKEAEPRD